MGSRAGRGGAADGIRRAVRSPARARRPLLLIAATLCGAVAGASQAQPVRNRILERWVVRTNAKGWTVELRFSGAVRYLRHAPRSRGRFVHIQVENLAVAGADLGAALQRESLGPPDDSDVPIAEVVYDGGADEGPALDVRFSRTTRFEVRQGADLRGIVLEIAREGDAARRPAPETARARRPRVERPALPATPGAAPLPEVVVDLRDPFAVELESVPRDADFAPLPDDDALLHHRVYETTFIRDGAAWKRRRLGFFPDAKSAEAARDALRPHYPDARVVEVSRAERIVSAWTALPPPVRPGTPPAPEPPPAPAPDAAPMPRVMREARDALTAGDLERAIRLLTQAVAFEENPLTPDARELLGVARERNGQLAHAVGEYQEYLDRYPDAPGATRVRQRLQALLTRKAEPAEPLRPARARSSEWDVGVSGSAATSYYRVEVFPDGGRPVRDSSSLSDLNVSLRLRSRDTDLLTRAAGDYRIDLPDGSGDELRVSSLFAEVAHRPWGVTAAVGRQSSSTGGVLGRFDGASLGVDVGDGWILGGVAGFPVDFDRPVRIDTGRRFAGVSLQAPRLFGALDGQIWAVGQWLQSGPWDREAVGAELRWVDEGRFAAAFVDYDVHFLQLNSALLVASWRPGWDTDLNATFDYRTGPVLTLSNALIGQPVGSIRELEQTFTLDEIEQLARDRSARLTSGTLSATHHLTETVQITADGTVDEQGRMPASGGVPAVEGTGLEYRLGLQLLANSLFVDGDVAILGVRWFDGGFADEYGASVNARFPALDGLRVNPRLDLAYRDVRGLGDALSVRPALRLDWQLGKIFLDGEIGLQWTNRRGSDVANEVGYTAQVGIRYDFY